MGAIRRLIAVDGRLFKEVDRHEFVQKAYGFITRHKGCTSLEIADAIGNHRTTAAKFLREMTDSGLVERRAETAPRGFGRHFLYYPIANSKNVHPGPWTFAQDEVDPEWFTVYDADGVPMVSAVPHDVAVAMVDASAKACAMPYENT